MDHFLYRNGMLHAEDVPCAEIAAAVGTPFYVYSTATLTAPFPPVRRGAGRACRHLVCYAMKAASNQAILKTLAEAWRGHGRGLGRRICPRPAAGVPGERIVFSGVGKTEEMRLR
jgi:diaminopimelate decarboxylase